MTSSETDRGRVAQHDDMVPTADDAAVLAALSPTAPGHSVESGVVVDLAVVTPAATSRVASLMRLGVGAGALATLLAAAVATHLPGLQLVDEQFHGWVLTHRSGWDLTLARAVTWGGVTYLTLPLLVVVGAAARTHGTGRARLGAGVLLAGTASVGVYVMLAVNAGIGRARPPVADWAGAAGGPAFPSGHTTAGTLFALSCAWVLAPLLRRGRPRIVLWSVAAGYAAAVGWSRIWLGVHWPSDVVGGWLGALAFAAAAAAGLTLARRRWPTPHLTRHPGRQGSRHARASDPSTASGPSG